MPVWGQSRSMELDDGRQLSSTVSGSGRPTVLFEAGMGAGQHSWALVAPTVAARTGVVTYDRAGFGLSTVDPAPRELARAAADLIAVLREVDTGPAVLVAHSYGALIVRQVAATAPDLVAALVLVDPTDEGCDLYFAPSMERQTRMFAKALPALARLRATRLIAERVGRPLSPEDRRAFVAEASTLVAATAHANEMVHCDTDLRHLRDRPLPTVEVPITIISGTRRPTSQSARTRRDCLVTAHERRAATSPSGRHVPAADSEHMVMFTEPSVVIDEILRIVDVLDATPADHDADA